MSQINMFTSDHNVFLHCELIRENWPLRSRDLNRVDYCIWTLYSCLFTDNRFNVLNIWRKF